MSAHGRGVALGRRSLATRERTSGRLVAPFDLEVPINEAFYVLEPVGRNQHPDATSFISWIVETVARERSFSGEELHKLLPAE